MEGRSKRPRHEGRTMGAPKQRSEPGRYTTEGGIIVDCAVRTVDDVEREQRELVQTIDMQRGLILESSYEFPGRYAHWTIGFTAPPLVLEAWGRSFRVTALNARGRVLMRAVQDALSADAAVASVDASVEGTLRGEVRTSERWFPEEERSKQPSIFSVVRCLVRLFKAEEEPQLGLYGSFGYDLTLQFEPVELRPARGSEGQRDLVLYLPDRIFVSDVVAREAWVVSYEFSIGQLSTTALPREPSPSVHAPRKPDATRDHEAGEFAKLVELAKEEFRVGNLFEVVLSQRFADECAAQPSHIFSVLRERNPSPYGFAINLGEAEFLVGASPEMFVRVEPDQAGMRVETCPISGTITRGRDALEDAEHIKTILSDPKEESELTMCTDVDRNDKSRICVPGSVKVIGRRQIEMYSRLIHTVDHVEGYLRDGFDALDAFLVHMWAVTVTGAPKLWAMRFVEKHERSHRAWYGGAIGFAGFDGRVNTGLTLRTVHIQRGVASVRAGATLLYDSTPAAEEAETELKASAMRDAIRAANASAAAGTRCAPKDAGAARPWLQPAPAGGPAGSAPALRVLLVDHQDSFVHTLANYLKQTGAAVTTVRYSHAREALDELRPQLVVLSPGPGNPRDFECSKLIGALLERRLAVFGVCLGLQALVEHFGGKLGVLPHPQHGKPATVRLSPAGATKGSTLFEGLPSTFQVARYHSLFSLRDVHPSELLVTAETAQDGVIMAVEHAQLPVRAVQFHPESILTAPDHGLRILSNVVRDAIARDGGRGSGQNGRGAE